MKRPSQLDQEIIKELRRIHGAMKRVGPRSDMRLTFGTEDMV